MAHVSAGSGYQRATLVALAIAFVVGLLYSNTLASPFVFDDSFNIVENRFIRVTQLGVSELYRAASVAILAVLALVFARKHRLARSASSGRFFI